jgi:hypothetical protein
MEVRNARFFAESHDRLPSRFALPRVAGEIAALRHAFYRDKDYAK